MSLWIKILMTSYWESPAISGSWAPCLLQEEEEYHQDQGARDGARLSGSSLVNGSHPRPLIGCWPQQESGLVSSDKRAVNLSAMSILRPPQRREILGRILSLVWRKGRSVAEFENIHYLLLWGQFGFIHRFQGCLGFLPHTKTLFRWPLVWLWIL